MSAPRRGHKYSVAVDPGTGVGGDRTAVCITRTGFESFPDVQVAEFASDDIGNVEVAAWVTAIAAWYSQYLRRRRDRPNHHRAKAEVRGFGLSRAEALRVQEPPYLPYVRQENPAPSALREPARGLVYERVVEAHAARQLQERSRWRMVQSQLPLADCGDGRP